MGNDIVISENKNLSAIQVQAQVNLVQEVMKQVMKVDVHYGKPFKASKKHALLKPGAEKLCMTFRIAPEYDIEDLSNLDIIRYRIKCKGVHIPTGMDLGYGVGECSSDEDKYKWRASLCDAEFESFSVDKTRTKFKKDYGNVIEVKQIRTEIADNANTVLKIGKKRALVDMVLTVTAASDLFDQDIEDLPEHLMQDNEEIPREAMPVEKKTTVKKETVKKGTAVADKSQEDVSQKCYKLIEEIVKKIETTSEEEIVKDCSKFVGKDKHEVFETSIANLAARNTDKWLLTTFGKIKKMHEEFC